MGKYGKLKDQSSMKRMLGTCRDISRTIPLVSEGRSGSNELESRYVNSK